MKYVCIIGPGVALPLVGRDLHEAVAFVPTGMSVEDVVISADLLKVPYFRKDESFRLSPQAVKVVPTLRQMKRLGSGIYQPLPQSFVDTVDWREMRGISTELVTAYLLARALGAERVRWYFMRGVANPFVSPLVRDCLLRNGVEVAFKPLV